MSVCARRWAILWREPGCISSGAGRQASLTDFDIDQQGRWQDISLRVGQVCRLYGTGMLELVGCQALHDT